MTNKIVSQIGATLVELVVSIVIISVAVAGVLLVMSRNVAHSGDPLVREQLIAVANSYLEEIMLQSFADPDGVGGEDRPVFDDVLDYHGLVDNGCVAGEATVECPLGICPCDQTGAPISGLTGYSVTVNVVQDGGNLGVAGSVPGADAVRVDVTASHHSGESISISGYRTNY